MPRIRTYSLLQMILFVTTSSHATPLLYSVDITDDLLVVLDAASGAVTPIGPLNHDVVDVDLAILNGQLYAINTIFNEQRAELLRIDQEGGAATLLGNLHRENDTVTHAEGLTAAGGSLLVGFTVDINDVLSSRLGNLSLLGGITNDLETGMDLDALSIDANDQIYAVDTDTSASLNVLATVPPTNVVGNYPLTNGRINDIVFSDAQLYGIPVGRELLHVIDASNGSLSAVIFLDRNGSYSGLAVAPEPAAAASFLIAMMIFNARSISKQSHS